MLESLKEAFNEVAKLPEDEQRHIVEIIKKAIASEKRWQTLFHDPRSEYVLRDMVAEALAEDEAGETEEIIGDSFLP
jgi:spermidine synthase